MLYPYLELNTALTKNVRIDRTSPTSIVIALISNDGKVIDMEMVPTTEKGELTPHDYNTAIGLIRGYRAVAEYNSLMAARMGVARAITPFGTLVAYKADTNETDGGIAVDLVRPDGTSGRVALIDFSESEALNTSHIGTFAFDGFNAEPEVYTACDPDGPMMLNS